MPCSRITEPPFALSGVKYQARRSAPSVDEICASRHPTCAMQGQTVATANLAGCSAFSAATAPAANRMSPVSSNMDPAIATIVRGFNVLVAYALRGFGPVGKLDFETF